MKKMLYLVLLLMMIFTVSACSQNVEEPEVVIEEPTGDVIETPEVTTPEEPLYVKAMTPEGATTIAMLKMIYEQPELMNNVIVEYESINSTDLLASEIIAEKVDFALIPTNLAIKLYNKGVPYKFVSINTHGNLYMITSEDIDSWDSLKGKDVYMIGQGLVPDLIFRALLEANGLDPENDLNIIYLAGTSEVGPTYIAGKSTITIMPEPVLSTLDAKGISYNMLFDLQEEYEKISGIEGGFPQAGLVVRNTIAEVYPDLVVAFADALSESSDWLNEFPDLAGGYAEQLELGIPAPVFVKAVDGLNIRHEDAFLNKEKLESFFMMLYSFSPEAIGGKMPDEDFYFKR
ncbi:MAG: ABC transporter substrate-binding protein [Bacillota bacterium]|nr:ABC transporter substrate-binding protein [Bacillota bacterium]